MIWRVTLAPLVTWRGVFVTSCTACPSARKKHEANRRCVIDDECKYAADWNCYHSSAGAGWLFTRSTDHWQEMETKWRSCLNNITSIRPVDMAEWGRWIRIIVSDATSAIECQNPAGSQLEAVTIHPECGCISCGKSHLTHLHPLPRKCRSDIVAHFHPLGRHPQNEFLPMKLQVRNFWILFLHFYFEFSFFFFCQMHEIPHRINWKWIFATVQIPAPINQWPIKTRAISRHFREFITASMVN